MDLLGGYGSESDDEELPLVPHTAKATAEQAQTRRAAAPVPQPAAVVLPNPFAEEPLGISRYDWV